MQDILDFYALIEYEFLKRFVFIIVMDNKGGVGKSLIAQLFANLLRFNDKYFTRVLDTDTSNSSSVQVDNEARMTSLTEKTGLGAVARAFQDVFDKIVRHIVMDVGAREEELIKKLLVRWVDIVGKLNGRVVVVRPITLGSHNQRNAAEFMQFAIDHGIAVVFVRNEGQGRKPEYFDRWIASQTRADAIRKGAVETYVEDADVRYTDEAIGFGISIADVANRDFSKILDEVERAEAEVFFDLDIAAFLSDWLRQSVNRFGEAVKEAIANVEARHNAAAGVSHETSTTPSTDPDPRPSAAKRGSGKR